MTASRTTFSYFDRFFGASFCMILDQVIYYKFFLLTQINLRFLVSYHTYFNIFLRKKHRIYALEDGGVAGGFMLAHFFMLQFCLKVVKVSIGH